MCFKRPLWVILTVQGSNPNFFKSKFGPFSASFSLFFLFVTVVVHLIVNKIGRWLDLNHGSLMSEATVLLTEPQQLPIKIYYNLTLLLSLNSEMKCFNIPCKTEILLLVLVAFTKWNGLVWKNLYIRECPHLESTIKDSRNHERDKLWCQFN